MEYERTTYTAPAVINAPLPNQGVWLGGDLFDCFNDCGLCCITFWLPCLTYAENRQLVRGTLGGSDSSDVLIYTAVALCTGCQCLLGMGARSELRAKYNLPETPCGDCCVHCCCHSCALCQEARELRARPITQWPVVGMVTQGPAAVAPGEPVQGYPGTAHPAYMQPAPPAQDVVKPNPFSEP